MNSALVHIATGCLLFAATPTSLAAQHDAELTVDNLAKWRAAILPSAEEMAWRKIDWRSELHTALLDGHTADKPILLWAMNGHPLGCV